MKTIECNVKTRLTEIKEIPDIVRTQEEIDSELKANILSELVELDTVLRRAEEDLYNAMTSIEKANVPQIFKERLARKQELRIQFQDLT